MTNQNQPQASVRKKQNTSQTPSQKKESNLPNRNSAQKKILQNSKPLSNRQRKELAKQSRKKRRTESKKEGPLSQGEEEEVVSTMRTIVI